MARPARPKFPKTTKGQRKPGPEQVALFDVPKKAAKTAASSVRTGSVAEGVGVLDPRFRKNYRRRITEVDEEGYRWESPTSSSNPARPRTLQAGYNARERTLRVVFRDGTPYEYYGVEPILWQRFKRSASPGRFINRILNQYPYARTDFEPPGGNHHDA